MNKAGFGGLNQNFNGDNRSEDIFGQLETLKSQFIPARVTDIIISNTHPLFDENGGWSSIGTIFFESIDNLGNSTSTTSNPVATPLLPYIKNYPLINELVLLFNLPGKNISKSTNATNLLQYYYLNPIAVWNHPHHNAYPNLIDSITNASQDINYEQIENGIVRGVSSSPSNIELNSPLTNRNSFIEKTNIHPLLPFAGDNIYEGRWGNSIRFGSTVPPISVSGSSNTPEYQNNWSFVGQNGDPITILRNGQPKDSSDAGWLPIIENIREDLSSIYMTSYQQIPLRASNEDYSALSPSPLLPREFFNPQIILNSERLIFNATKDSILASAQDSISLSSDNQIGLTSKNVNISGETIKLGGPTADEPVILGGSFMQQFKILIDQIQVMSIALGGLEGFDPTATNIETTGIDLAAQDLELVCKALKKLLPSDGKITSPLLSNTIRIR